MKLSTSYNHLKPNLRTPKNFLLQVVFSNSILNKNAIKQLKSIFLGKVRAIYRLYLFEPFIIAFSFSVGKLSFLISYFLTKFKAKSFDCSRRKNLQNYLPLGVNNKEGTLHAALHSLIFIWKL